MNTIQGIGASALAAGITGAVSVWTKPSKLTYHYDVSVAEHVTELDLSKILKKPQDLYISPGIRPLGLPTAKAGKTTELVGLWAFAADVDTWNPTRAHSNLPKTDEDVAEILAAVPFEPTFVVASGSGTARHAWWVFEQAQRIDSPDDLVRLKKLSVEFHRPMVELSESKGWHIDSSSKLNQWLRLPGSLNHKHDPSTLVQITSTSREYSFDELTKDLVLDRRSVTSSKNGQLGGRPSKTTPTPTPTLASPAATATATASTAQIVRERIARINPQHEHRDKVDALLAGQSIWPAQGAKGYKRDEAFWKLVSTIIFHLPRNLPPDEVRDELIAIFEPSLSVWADEPGATKTLDEELDKLEVKISAALAERDVKDAEKEARQAADAEVLRDAIRSPISDGATNGDGATTKAVSREEEPDLTRYSILQWGGQYYVYSFGWIANPTAIGYMGPFKQEELIAQLHTLWELAPASFALTYWHTTYEGKANEKTVEKPKTVPMLMKEYGTGILKAEGNLVLDKSWYDPITKTLHQALCPLRVQDECFDPLIDEWLRLMGGAKADKLLDWVASVVQLQRQTCALYLEGPMSIGKNVLANGLSRLWQTTGPTDFSMIMSTGSGTPFNAGLFRQPFCQLDEGLPSGAKQTSAEIRKMIGRGVHTSNDKGEKHVNVEGTVRLIITANNDAVLLQLSAEDYSENDMEAFTHRILHIKGEQAAADFIANLNAKDRSIVDSWIQEDKIAKHALWLALHRQFTPGKRFLVEGETTEMHRALVTRGDRNGSVLQILATYMNDPTAIARALTQQMQGKPGMILGNGKLYVNTTALAKAWSVVHSKDQRALTLTGIGRVLGSLSHGRVKLGPRGDRIQYHDINVEHVISWAKGNVQIGDEDAMRDNLARVIKLPNGDDSDDGGGGAGHSGNGADGADGDCQTLM